MALKDTWIPKKDTTDGSDGDYIVAEDINEIADAVIVLENIPIPDSYTKEEVDNMLSLKRDINDFVPVSSDFGENEDNISLVGITDITYETAESYPEISDNYVVANGSEKATFFINFKGNATISIISTHLLGTDRFAYGVVKVDGVELTGVRHAPIEEQYYTEYTFNGDIKKGIEIQADAYTKWLFTTFSGSRIIYSDGFMSGEQAERLDNIDSKIGDIDSELDELLSSKADAEDVYTKEQADTLLLQKADNDDVYTKDDIDTLLSKKRDNDDFTPIASADKAQETISLVGITTVETSDDENGWEITSNTLSATINPLFSDGAIFHIDFQGNVNLEIDANAFEGVGFNPAEAGYVEIDGIKLTAENVSSSGCKYRYIGDITREITIQAKYARYEFATFIKNIKIYSDGFMSGEQADKLDTLESQIGDIDSALDELHSYAEALKSGGGA